MFFNLYLVALPVFIVLDLLWIGVVAKSFYHSQIGELLRPDVQWGAAIAFYLLFIAGLVVFVIAPAATKHSLWHALMYGALFGLVCYATYNLTNLAVAKNWPLLVTIVDMMWGAVLAASVSGITYFIATKIV